MVVGIAKLIDLLEYSIIMNWDLIPEKYVVFRFLYQRMVFWIIKELRNCSYGYLDISLLEISKV